MLLLNVALLLSASLSNSLLYRNAKVLPDNLVYSNITVLTTKYLLFILSSLGYSITGLASRYSSFVL